MLEINWHLVWWPLLAMLLLLVVSAFISASEVALFSLSPVQKEELRESDDPVNADIIQLLEKPDRERAPRKLLATILIANNAVNIAIVLLSSLVAAELVPAHRYPLWMVFVVHVAVVTFIILLFGEMIPKIYATRSNLTVARIMARPLIIACWLFTPISALLLATSRYFESLLRKNTNTVISVDELGHALELTANEERTAEEHKILEGIVTFGAKEVAQIMTPRTEIAALPDDSDFDSVLKFIRHKGFSRIPVYKNSLDDISGFLFIKDLLPYYRQADFHWQSLVRPPYFVSENKKIDDLLQEFQRDKIHLAIVVDEYGGTSGLVTLEDVLEEVVGEIADEFDEDENRYSQLDERNYVFEAHIALSDLCRILNIDESEFEEARGDNTTLAGLLIELAGKIPARGEVIHFNGYRFAVEVADHRKVKRVKITLPELQQDQDEDI